MGFGGLFDFENELKSAFNPNLVFKLRMNFTANGTITDPKEMKLFCDDKPKQRPTVVVNRPFLFYVIDLATRTPYLSGVVWDPDKTVNAVADHDDKQYKNLRESDESCDPDF